MKLRSINIFLLNGVVLWIAGFFGDQ
jgi:hypothetical protein